jgi:SAM-dependent methyltransferase
MFDERRWSEAAAEVDAAVRLLGLEPPAAILDLCCGPGRHALELARRGFRATGVDATGPFLREAEALANAEGLEVELVHEDMRVFRREGGFDAVLNMATSFGYFEDPGDDRLVLENVCSSLRPGGSLLMELQGKEVVCRTLRQPEWHEENDIVLLTEQRVRESWSWVDNRLVVLADGARQELVLSHRLYSATELSAMLAGAGFASVECFGSLSGSPYDEQAERLVVIGRAPY